MENMSSLRKLGISIIANVGTLIYNEGLHAGFIYRLVKNCTKQPYANYQIIILYLALVTVNPYLP